ncbi:MAG: DUF2490 domain-containing protein [Chryseolinea sp.]
MRKRIISALLLSIVYGVGNAQSPSTQVWTEYMLNLPFANSWNVEFASTYSTVLEQPKWRSLDVQITPEYAVSNHLDVMGAVFGGRTYQETSVTTSEVREMLGARIHFTPNSRILTRCLIRFEQRNMLERETDVWEHSTRTRLRAETITPINKKSMQAGDHLWYAIVDGEFFFVMDQDVQERFANRFRLRTGIGYRLSYSVRFELMYTLQSSRNTLEDGYETTDNIIRFRLKHFLNKNKPSKAEGISN